VDASARPRCRNHQDEGRTHLAYKAEHAIIDLETGAIVGVTVQGADQGDTTTMQQTLLKAAAQLEAVAAVIDDAVKPIEEASLTRAVTAERPSTIWRRSRFAPTSASLTADHNRGSIDAPNAMRCMPIGGASAARAATPPSPTRRTARTPCAHLYETGGLRRAHVRTNSGSFAPGNGPVVMSPARRPMNVGEKARAWCEFSLSEQADQIPPRRLR
jgi:transposase